MANQRILWADQTKGIGIFLMIYAHNFPFLESYIYTFHMPLFFFTAGMFHPKLANTNSIFKRAKSILIPYFIWSLLLYLFWLFFGRFYGNAVNLNLSAVNNFIGIFYAQGDNTYMNWGIPMWFLPCIFISFCLFYFLQKLEKKPHQIIGCILLIGLGFLYAHYFSFKLPWSIDIACVSLVFYATGFYLKDFLIKLKTKQTIIFLILILILHFSFAFFNFIKVDMYRAIYGNPLIFISNGITGTLMVILFLKLVKLPSFVSYLGKHTLVLLALHGRALTIIKLVLVLLGFSILSFSEITKFGLAILQCILIVPAIWGVNKYIPILDGKINK